MSDFLDDYLNTSIDLKSLIDKVDFTDEEVEDAARDHPKLYKRAVKYRVRKMRDRVEAELAYESKIAKLSAKYQDRKDEKGKRKLTEGAVKSKVQLDPEIQKLRRKMEFSHVHEKFSELLLRVYDKREFAIKVIMKAREGEIDKIFKSMAEDGGKKMSKKLQEEVRNKYRRVKSSGESSDD